MSRKSISHVDLSPTLSLSEGHDGYWLWDNTREMNLSMRAKTERSAFVEALHYYQRRLIEVEQKHKEISAMVDTFVEQVRLYQGDEQ